jgi:hypothetical protein
MRLRSREPTPTYGAYKMIDYQKNMVHLKVACKCTKFVVIFSQHKSTTFPKSTPSTTRSCPLTNVAWRRRVTYRQASINSYQRKTNASRRNPRNHVLTKPYDTQEYDSKNEHGKRLHTASLAHKHTKIRELALFSPAMQVRRLCCH